MNLRRVDRAGSPGSQDGVSLIELIFAVFLLGTATVTILGAFATLVKTSDLSRKTGDAGSTLAAVAEAVADNQRNPYEITCNRPAYDPTAGVALPSTIQSADVSITTVQWWDGRLNDGAGGFSPTCPVDAGGAPLRVPSWRLQLIEVRVRSTDGKVDRRITVVKRG